MNIFFLFYIKTNCVKFSKEMKKKSIQQFIQHFKLNKVYICRDKKKKESLGEGVDVATDHFLGG